MEFLSFGYPPTPPPKKDSECSRLYLYYNIKKLEVVLVFFGCYNKLLQI